MSPEIYPLRQSDGGASRSGARSTRAFTAWLETGEWYRCASVASWRIFESLVQRIEDRRKSAKGGPSLRASLTDGLQGGQASTKDYNPPGNVIGGIVGRVVC